MRLGLTFNGRFEGVGSENPGDHMKEHFQEQETFCNLAKERRGIYTWLAFNRSSLTAGKTSHQFPTESATHNFKLGPGRRYYFGREEKAKNVQL
ncbi:unnamed protein product [Nezara viridula]|uniref:Uncharacterized protein n=1 Tax=Nezara viridula TaxID=85310 RepID=A0A9P0GX68_NEZVI|nr:unnamed protein product [Nezara viridula]